jgi:hypothetical protein
VGVPIVFTADTGAFSLSSFKGMLNGFFNAFAVWGVPNVDPIRFFEIDGVVEGSSGGVIIIFATEQDIFRPYTRVTTIDDTWQSVSDVELDYWKLL